MKHIIVKDKIMLGEWELSDTGYWRKINQINNMPSDYCFVELPITLKLADESAYVFPFYSHKLRLLGDVYERLYSHRGFPVSEIEIAKMHTDKYLTRIIPLVYFL